MAKPKKNKAEGSDEPSGISSTIGRWHDAVVAFLTGLLTDEALMDKDHPGIREKVQGVLAHPLVSGLVSTHGWPLAGGARGNVYSPEAINVPTDIILPPKDGGKLVAICSWRAADPVTYTVVAILRALATFAESECDADGNPGPFGYRREGKDQKVKKLRVYSATFTKLREALGITMEKQGKAPNAKGKKNPYDVFTLPKALHDAIASAAGAFPVDPATIPVPKADTKGSPYITLTLANAQARQMGGFRVTSLDSVRFLVGAGLLVKDVDGIKRLEWMYSILTAADEEGNLLFNGATILSAEMLPERFRQTSEKGKKTIGTFVVGRDTLTPEEFAFFSPSEEKKVA